jgi:hypothetical protein
LPGNLVRPQPWRSKATPWLRQGFHQVFARYATSR